MIQNPYTDDWKNNAYQVAMEQFQLQCNRVAEEVHPTPECNHSSAEWEKCLDAGCNINLDQITLAHQLIERHGKMAHDSIMKHMVEPEGSYFGTSSCYVNAAVRGVQAIATRIK